MTITYPITLPLNPAPSRFTLNATSFSSMTQSPFSAAQQVQLLQGQLWSFSVDYPPMSEDQARNWFGTLSQLNGRFGTFLFGDPRWKSPRGNWAGAPVVNGASQVGQILNMSGFAASAIVRAGDYFQIGSGSSAKLHVVTQDVVAGGGGLAALDIWPRLRASPSNGSALVTASPKGVFRMSSPNLSRSWEPFRHGLSFEMVEAL